MSFSQTVKMDDAIPILSIKGRLVVAAMQKKVASCACNSDGPGADIALERLAVGRKLMKK